MIYDEIMSTPIPIFLPLLGMDYIKKDLVKIKLTKKLKALEKEKDAYEKEHTEIDALLCLLEKK